MDDQRPKLIPPMVRSNAALEVVREIPKARREVEHPHCDEHFLFTPHCAACLEAERTQHATAKATPIETSRQAQPARMPQQSSRSFGFTDNIPSSLTHEPSFAERTILDMERDIERGHDSLIDLLLDI